MKKKEFVRNPYNYDADELSTDTGLACLDESRTEQQHAEEADINYIADRFLRTGEMPQLLQMPTSGDFSGTFDFQSAMNLIVKAKNEFMSLPAKIRTRFSNDPAQLIAFMEDPENRDEAIKLGFIDKPDTMEPPELIRRQDGPETSRSAESTPEKPTGSRGASKPPKGGETTEKP